MLYVLFLTVALICLHTLMNHCMFRRMRRERIRYKARIDQCYVVNLKKRPDRRGRFRHLYKKSDISKVPLVIQTAVDGSRLDLSKVPLTESAQAELTEQAKTKTRTQHYQLTPGAIGCYFSHYHVFRDIMYKGYGCSLIFEDDANVPRDMQYMGGMAVKNVPSDWDIVVFIPNNLCHDCQGNTAYRNAHVRKVSRFWGLHCYLIKHSAVAKLLNDDARLLFPIKQQLDHQLSELARNGSLNIYSCYNTPVLQYRSSTDIQIPLQEQSKLIENPFHDPSQEG